MLSREQRAKIFLPFDALNGFREALIEKEIESEEKKDFFDEACNVLQVEFNKIEIGSSIYVMYYSKKRYVSIKGIVTGIDYIKKKIRINDELNINICDICKIEVNC